ncbi:MAG: DUF177 domain-containing protein [Arenibacter algicola]|nr:DUF177 domain-containing protein [Arenibacter algicola]
MAPENDNPHPVKVEFSRPVQVADLTTGERSIDIEATPGERDARAARLGVNGLDALSARAALQILSNGDVRLTMHAQARVRQTCVVTLAPMESDVNVDFTTTYSAAPVEDWGHDEEEFADIDADIEPPEPLENGQIDLGEAAVEQLALEIDPFPRVKGATFDGFTTDPNAAEEDAKAKPNPFAVLSKLKTTSENQG